MVVRVRVLLVSVLGLAIACFGQVVAVASPTEPVIHFVVDVSGSMSGTKLEQAQAAIQVTAQGDT